MRPEVPPALVSSPGPLLRLDGRAGTFRLSEHRPKVFKGFDQPVDVVSVEGR